MAWSSTGRPDNLVPADLSKIDPLYVSLLSLCTPHGTERRIINVIRNHFKENKSVKLMVDEEKDNLVINIGESRTIFSSHMDIVGSNSTKDACDLITLMETPVQNKGPLAGFLFGAKKVKIGKDIKYVQSTLGADDKTGVYIMLKMIDKGIPGRYIFHTGEECGCIGSTHLLNNYPSLFKDIDRAIAFDRADYGDTIAFQRSNRCSSVEFSKELASKLNKFMPPKQQFKDNVHGVYTDTAVYMGKIPECCNLSVGYFSQHGPQERQDYLWLSKILLPAILEVDFSDLPTVRDPAKKEVTVTRYYGSEYDDEGYGYNGTRRNGNISYNTQKTTWKTVTKDTQTYNLPDWNLSDGFVEEVDKEILVKCVQRFLNMATWGAKQLSFIEDLLDMLELFGLVIDENVALKAQINRLMENKGITKPVQATKVKDKSSLNVIDPEIARKKGYLKALIDISEDGAMGNYYLTTLSSYVYGANKYIEKTKNRKFKHEYSKADISKLNRLIWAVAYILDLSDAKSMELNNLLSIISKYILAHASEDGFEQRNIKLIEHEDVKKAAVN